MPPAVIEHLILVSLLALMTVTAGAIALTRSLFAAAMLFGIFSLLSAAVFVVLDAVDVAFTEAAVGAGISTILMLATLARTNARQRAGPRLRPGPLALAAGLVLLLAWASRTAPASPRPRPPRTCTSRPATSRRDHGRRGCPTSSPRCSRATGATTPSARSR